MKPGHDPEHLDIKAFSRAGDEIKGSCDRRRFQRLTSECLDPPAGAVAEPIHYRALGQEMVGSHGESQSWLELEISTAVFQTCQRCLCPAAQALRVHRRFRFVATEEQAEREDVSAEEDVLVAVRDFDLLTLVEDELLMALPLVPLHEDCPSPVTMQVADRDFSDADNNAPPRFAALRDWKPRG